MSSVNNGSLKAGQITSEVPVAFMAIPGSMMPAPKAPQGWSCPPVATSTSPVKPSSCRTPVDTFPTAVPDG